MEDIKIDLHMHTKNSDGTQSVQEILEELKNKGATIVSITDHDTTKGYFDLRKSPEILPDGMTIIPGIEITCNINNNPRDMLGYGIDIDFLNDYFEKRNTKEYMIKKEQKILEEFMQKCLDYGFVLSNNLKVVNGKKSEGFTTVYNELVKHSENIEKCPDLKDISYFYWQNVANQKTSLFVSESFDMPSFKEASDLIHKAGGMSFLAHPYCYKLPDDETDALIKAAVDAGIDGIELQHSTHTDREKERIEMLAKKYNLYMSGGSDYHGTHKPKIESLTGTNHNVKVEYEKIKPWFEKIKKFSCKNDIINDCKNSNI